MPSSPINQIGTVNEKEIDKLNNEYHQVDRSQPKLKESIIKRINNWQKLVDVSNEKINSIKKNFQKSVMPLLEKMDGIKKDLSYFRPMNKAGRLDKVLKHVKKE